MAKWYRVWYFNTTEWNDNAPWAGSWRSADDDNESANHISYVIEQGELWDVETSDADVKPH